MVSERCPACRTRVSETATNCPHCGYRDNDPRIPIVLSKCTPSRKAWNVAEAHSPIDRLIAERIMNAPSFQQAFGRADNLMQIAPAFTEFIRSLKPHDVKVASITSEMQRLIDNGGLSFRFDKNGEMLAQLTRGDGRISNNLRLRDLSLTPELGPALVNLQAQLTMMQILGELRAIQWGIDELRRSLQDDRLAIVDSAWHQLTQAATMEDSRLREQKLLDALSHATDAKCQLIRTVERDRTILKTRRNSLFERISGSARKEGEANSTEIFASLIAIMEAVEIEAASYVLLGEEKSAWMSLKQFIDFTARNDLDDRNTLLRINSFVDGNFAPHADFFLEKVYIIKDSLLEYQSRTDVLLPGTPHKGKNDD